MCILDLIICFLVPWGLIWGSMLREMVEKPEIEENRSAAFLYKNKQGPHIPPWCSKQGSCVTTGLKRTQTDQLLENTIVNDVRIKVGVVYEPPLLTKCEVQILQSILTGKTNKQIARTLSRSCRTIEYHRNRLMRKLNVRNAAELVKQAIAMGIA